LRAFYTSLKNNHETLVLRGCGDYNLLPEDKSVLEENEF
jgi:hypothetical protein